MHKLNVGNHQVVHRAGFASDITDHAYFSQVHVCEDCQLVNACFLLGILQNGIPFVNAVANVAMKGGRVVSFGSSFVKTGEESILLFNE